LEQAGMTDTTGTAQNYYEHEKVRVICNIEIGYKKGNEASRKDALVRATELHLDAAGVSANGCYRARVVSAKIADGSQVMSADRSVAQVLRDVYRTHPICMQAADKIDQLQQEIKGLREAVANQAAIIAGLVSE
jgi:hypothetical protein